MRFSPTSLQHAAFAGLVISTAHPAAAQTDADRANARHLGEEGSVALDRKDFARAEEDFRRADALFHAPTLLLGLARAQAGLRKDVEAAESYRRIVLEHVTTNTIFRKALEQAQRELPDVEAKRARVTLRVGTTDATAVAPERVAALLDGSKLRAEALGVERFVDPGDHVVTASADGFDEARESFRVNEGEAKTVTLTLSKSTPAVAALPPAGPAAVSTAGGVRRPLTYASLAVGSAGLLAGAIAGGLAVSKHSSISQDGCGRSGQPLCSTAGETSDISAYHTLGLASDIGFAVFGAFTVTGVVLWVTTPKDAPAPAVTTGLTLRPYLGWGGGGIEGTF